MNKYYCVFNYTQTAIDVELWLNFLFNFSTSASDCRAYRMKRQQIGVCSRSHLILFLNKARIKMTPKEAISEERKDAIGVSIEKKPHACRTGCAESVNTVMDCNRYQK